ncbi:MAG: hypothetical protein AABX29_05295 [Nanoarchaeota archaeon]
MQDTPKIKKIELEHQKLLTEYNAILIALATMTLGVGGLIYTLTENILLSLVGLSLIFFILNSEKESKSKEVDDKVKEII